MKGWTMAGLMLVVAAACGDEGSSSGEGGGGGAANGVTSGAGGQGGDPGDPYAHLYDCEEVAFSEGRPLSGPGYDPETGLTGAPQASYVLHATQIYVKPEQQDAFFAAVGKVLVQLGQSEGLVAYGLATDDGCGVARTMGVWTSEEAMYAFVASGAHLEAMQRTAELSYTGKTTQWTGSADDVVALTWDVARAKLDAVDSFGAY